MKIFKSKKLIQKIIISMFLLILVFNLVMPSVVYGEDQTSYGKAVSIKEFIEKSKDKEATEKKIRELEEMTDAPDEEWNAFIEKINDDQKNSYVEDGEHYRSYSSGVYQNIANENETSSQNPGNDGKIEKFEKTSSVSDIVGGVLLNPLVDLICALGDSVINLVQSALDQELGVTEFFNTEGHAFMVDADEYLDSEGRPKEKYVTKKYNSSTSNGETKTFGEVIEVNSDDFDKGWLNTRQMYQIPTVTYSPEEIFSGRVPALDINFISPTKDTTTSSEGDVTTTNVLHTVIAQWYVTLRNIAIIGLQVILVYVGIRMVTSSIAAEKAKYKQLFVDWLIGLCLIFVLHYLMLFILNLTSMICQAISPDSMSVAINVTGNGSIPSASFTTNLLGEVRFLTQYSRLITKITYTILYIFLVYYTVFFTFVYLKRLILMAFLTVIAPLVALTYPIDKMNDGSAQAFNAWLKEYIYNALIQPFHLILYMVLLNSAADLVKVNFIYAIAALWFITKAEGLLRQIFGFNKAPSLGNTMGGFAGGMLASNLLKRGKGSSAKKGNGSGGNGAEDGNKKVRFNKKASVAEIGELAGLSPVDAEENKDNDKENNITDERDRLKTEDSNTQPTEQLNRLNPEGTDDNTQKTASEKFREEMKNVKNRANNWANNHGGWGKVGKRALKGAVKTGMRFTSAGAGIVTGAIAGAATGKGVTGMLTGATAGGKLGSMAGSKAADMTINAAGAVTGGSKRIFEAMDTGSMAPILGGTALGRELDLANGNTRYQDAEEIRAFKNDDANLQYIKDMLTAKNNGEVPSMREVKKQMEEYNTYLEKGMRDIQTITKADKIANSYDGLSKEQVAQIAMVGKDKGITKDNLSERNIKDTTRNLNQDFRNANFDKATSDKLTKQSIDVLKALNGVANDLQKKK